MRANEHRPCVPCARGVIFPSWNSRWSMILNCQTGNDVLNWRCCLNRTSARQRTRHLQRRQNKTRGGRHRRVVFRGRFVESQTMESACGPKLDAPTPPVLPSSRPLRREPRLKTTLVSLTRTTVAAESRLRHSFVMRALSPVTLPPIPAARQSSTRCSSPLQAPPAPAPPPWPPSPPRLTACGSSLTAARSTRIWKAWRAAVRLPRSHLGSCRRRPRLP